MKTHRNSVRVESWNDMNIVILSRLKCSMLKSMLFNLLKTHWNSVSVGNVNNMKISVLTDWSVLGWKF